MNERVAIIAIVVEKGGDVNRLNDILHDYRECIIGRMGIPYEKRGISLISIAVDGPSDKISALSGKLGMVDGITAKAVYSKLPE
ncbi:MAG: iron-only hydrogenase system regulator [Eubacteriales bacterium]|nr:iron-only hydrogenase system regulator [Eubacteriales bacterium]